MPGGAAVALTSSWRPAGRPKKTGSRNDPVSQTVPTLRLAAGARFGRPRSGGAYHQRMCAPAGRSSSAAIGITMPRMPSMNTARRHFSPDHAATAVPRHPWGSIFDVFRRFLKFFGVGTRRPASGEPGDLSPHYRHERRWRAKWTRATSTGRRPNIANEWRLLPRMKTARTVECTPWGGQA